MYKIIRFFNKNKKSIIKAILIIAFILIIIQILNNIAKNSKNINNNLQNSNEEIKYDNQLVSDKSMISGEDVSSIKLENDISVIDKFFNYCNNNNYIAAYDLLTDECKEEMFPIVDDFYNIYFSKIFAGEKKSYSVENWTGNIYEIKFSGDILSTGNLNDINQDYITIVKNDNNETKLNINNYIGRVFINKTTEYNNVQVNVESKDIYMDYEKYNFNVFNNSEYSIMLGNVDNTESIYLLDKNNMKYYFFNNEISNNNLVIKPKYKQNLEIKFRSSYIKNKKINYICFSELVMDYSEYKKIDDKSNYDDLYEFKVQV